MLHFETKLECIGISIDIQFIFRHEVTTQFTSTLLTIHRRSVELYYDYTAGARRRRQTDDIDQFTPQCWVFFWCRHKLHCSTNSGQFNSIFLTCTNGSGRVGKLTSILIIKTPMKFATAGQKTWSFYMLQGFVLGDLIALCTHTRREAFNRVKKQW